MKSPIVSDRRATGLLDRVRDDVSRLRDDIGHLLTHTKQETLPNSAREIADQAKQHFAAGSAYAASRLRGFTRQPPSHSASWVGGAVVTDVQLEAAEQAGGNAGQYCVSVHWFNPPFDSRTLERSFYEGEIDSTEACAADLSDGDQRTWRLVSKRTDLPVGTPARVQVHWSNSFNVKESVFAP